HGYGIQDFLQVNPRFGTDADLASLVRTAHDQGIYVILDIILNHTGNIFRYDPQRQPNYRDGQGNFDPRWDNNPYPVVGFNDSAGNPSLVFQRTDPSLPALSPKANSGVWPVEFQDPTFYTAKGRISNFDNEPEFREGDFFDLKDVHHGQGPIDDYRP